MTIYHEEFTDLILERDNKRVVWEYIGEGHQGDYNADDPNDKPMLRFCCDRWSPYVGTIGGEWEGYEDASYCTRMPVDTPIVILVQAAAQILEMLDHESYKKKLEAASWFCPQDFSI